MSETKNEMAQEEEMRKLCDLARRGNLVELEKLVNSDNANTIYCNNTLLMYVMQAGTGRRSRCIDLLMSRGAESSAVNSEGDTAMHVAARMNRADVMKQLNTKINSPINTTNSLGQTPLIAAAAEGSEMAVKQLLKLGADVDVEDEIGRTAADWANEWSSNSDMNWSITDAVKRRTPTAKEIEGRINERFRVKSIFDSAGRGDVATLECLLTKNNMNSRICFRTPLMLAADAANNAGENCFKLLIKTGADPSMTDRVGWTPAHYAADKGNFGILRLLKMPIVDLKDVYGRTPIMVAAKAGETETVKTLIQLGVDVNGCDNNGVTAITLAERNSHCDVVQLLKNFN